MKFLLNFFSCGVRSANPIDSTKLTVPPASQTLRRKKRHALDWRPSLGSISEDSTVPPSERGSERGLKRRSSTGAMASAAKVHYHNYSDDYDYGRVAMSTIMPPFSPMPFMF